MTQNNRLIIEFDNTATWAGYIITINKPMHFTDETFSCINLIFSLNLNLTCKCWIERPGHEKCHYTIIFGTLNFNIPPLLPYYKGTWDYKHGNIVSVRELFKSFIGRKHSRKKMETKNACMWLWKSTMDELMDYFFSEKRTKLAKNVIRSLMIITMMF